MMSCEESAKMIFDRSCKKVSFFEGEKSITPEKGVLVFPLFVTTKTLILFVSRKPLFVGKIPTYLCT